MLKSGEQIWVRDGRLLRLGTKLGQGGEGAVFELEGEPRLVAKIYSERAKASKQHKIDALIALADPKVSEMAAWPTMIVRLPDRAATVGFTMPRLDGFRPIHDVYTPSSRRTRFPEIDFGELLKVAHNLAVAIHRVHEKGCVIGDINEGNVFVGRGAAVKLIDCDSFQVPSANSTPFLCEVGVPAFTPPELQGQTRFDAQSRTVDHDAFGLAILIFHLIFLGRHPFAGKPTGGKEFTLEDAIKDHRFAYGPGANSRGLVRPDNIPMPDLNLVGPLMGRMFEVAFLPVNRARPQPAEWAAAIRALYQKLRVCPDESGHQFPNHLQSCPWCPMEQATSLVLFPLKDQTSGLVGIGFDINRFEKELFLVSLGSVMNKPAFDAMPDIKTRTRYKIVQGAIGISMLAVAGIAASLVPHLSPFGYLLCIVGIYQLARRSLPTYLLMRTALVRKLEKTTQQSIETLEKEASAAPYQQRKDELQGCVRDYRNLPNLLQAKITERQRQAREIQLQQFLDGFSIWDHKIRGFGAARKSSLAASSIHTAWDVYQAKFKANISGIGDGLWSDLQSWANHFSSRFVFDAKRAVSPDAMIGIKREVQQRRHTLESQMMRGLPELKAFRESLTSKRKHGLGKIAELVAARDSEATKLQWWLR